MTRAYLLGTLLAVMTLNASAQVNGSGTRGNIAVWTGATSIGNSTIKENASGGVSISVGSKTGFSATTTSSVPAAAGVIGQANATSVLANGVVGITSGTTGSAGVVGISNGSGSPTFGVVGTATTNPNGTGVQGNGSVNGVFGISTATSGYGFGLGGRTMSSGGVAGEFTNLTGSGLVLLGLSGPNLTTVFSLDASGNGSFAGNLNVTGNLVKGGGSFKIDHPADPANKYLSHSFVESPDMMNVYNGVTVLDVHGEVWVNLPTYFEALNRDFRYQLTAIGAPGPKLYIAEEISGNRFKIAGGKPGAKVSWQVTGIRQDAYANAHRIKVEEDKSAQERGHYLYPELFGATDKDAIGHNREERLLRPSKKLLVSEASTY